MCIRARRLATRGWWLRFSMTRHCAHLHKRECSLMTTRLLQLYLRLMPQHGVEWEEIVTMVQRRTRAIFADVTYKWGGDSGLS